MIGFIPLAAIFVFFQLIVSLTSVDDGKIAVAQTDTTTIGQSMLVLHGFAALYASKNPGYTGYANDATLGSPSWYNRPSYVGSYLTGGKAYVYYTGAVQGLPAYLVTTSGDIYGAGTNQNGVLMSPSATPAATASLTIPSQVPNGSVVVMP
ncbi:type IV pilus biogenesis protein PilM [Burkholderia sp. Tr-20390]|uniref:type IV pilus biogenesis protein PilM n=1 Tax=Burkholderia sp. Tr-20390 TaxID=2703904 RepID=UPI001981C47F|nr:type IV pilus biogenesis protein PilM [Burkholderia sp. Tr-20390]MBN3729533.1 type IV pilus biogenesis protein PilM [Burkholderia sp. Tr-20390]